MSHSRKTKPTVLYEEGAFQEFSDKQLEHIFGGNGPFLETAPAKTQFLKAYGTYDYEHKPAKENKFIPVKVNTGPDYAVKSDFPRGPGGSEVPAWLWKDGDQEKVVKQLTRTSEEMMIPREWVQPKNTLKYSDLGGGGPGMPPGAGKAVEMMVGNMVAQREADREDALRRAMLERGVNPEEATRRVMERRAETARIDLERGRRTEEQRRREMLRQFAPTLEARAERERMIEEEIGGARTARQTAEEEARARSMLPPAGVRVARALRAGRVAELARARAGPALAGPPPVGGAGMAGGAGGLMGGGAVRRAVEEAMAGEGEEGGAEGIMRGGGGGGRGGARIGAGRRPLAEAGRPTKHQIRKTFADMGILTWRQSETRSADELYDYLLTLEAGERPGILQDALKADKK